MADVKFEVVNFALSTAAATNTQDITISGFGTPSAAIFIVSGAVTDDTVAADQLLSIGFTDGTRQIVHGIRNTDAAASATCVRTYKTAAVITNSVSNGSSDLLNFSFTSWITDGVRLTIDTQSASAFLATCILIGGADVANAYVDSKSMGTGTSPIAIDFSDEGGTDFEPDVVFTLDNRSTSDPYRQNGNILSFGCALNDGADTNRCIAVTTDTASDPTNNTSSVSNAEVFRQLNAGALLTEGNIDTFAATGFSITPSASTANSILSWLALKFTNSPDLDLFDMEYPTSGPYAETTPVFTPNFGLIAAVVGPTARNNLTTASTWGMSISAFDDTTVSTISNTSEDNVADTVAKSLHNTKIKVLDDDGSTVAVDQTSDPVFDSAGWDIALTTNPASAVLGWGFAVGTGAAPGGGGLKAGTLGLLGVGI